MRYSVIIPIYNAEKKLQRCLDSLVPQLNSNVEVLLINDGSSDSSGDICKEFVTKSSCFKYFEQQNSGVSAARNKGLDNATGDYILYVDSDDYVDPKYFETIESNLLKTNIDLLLFGISFLNRTENAICRPILKKEDFTGINVAYQYSKMSKQGKMSSLCDKAFKRTIIEMNRIRFDSSISIGEDAAFIFQYILNTDTMVVCKKVLYYVDESELESLSRKKRKNLVAELMICYQIMENTLSQSSISGKKRCIYQKKLSRGYYRNAYSCFNEVFRYCKMESEIDYKISSICSEFRIKGVKPIGMNTLIISLPVLFNLTHVIKLIFRLKNMKNRISQN